MKASSLREQTDEELRQAAEDAEKEILSLRVRKGAGDASQRPSRVRNVRRDLARIKTIMRERELKKNA